MLVDKDNVSSLDYIISKRKSKEEVKRDDNVE